MPESRWSQSAFLDTLRTQGDVLADQTVETLIAEHGFESMNRLFTIMNANTDALPADTPPAIVRYFTSSATLPSWVDHDQLRRGEDIFFEHAFPVALVLLLMSLPAGYSAPSLTQILHLSGDLESHPYKRLMGVLQMVVDVGSRDGFEASGRAIVTAQKLRLLHAGIRQIAHRRLPDYRATYGVPVNHEDMLATIMGFSYLVVVGMRRLGIPLSDTDAEDLYYPWRVFAHMMGIHPPDDPEDGSLVPADLASAGAFYDAYARRHFVGPDENPEGVTLTRDNLRMVQDFMPRVLRGMGLGVIPRIYMNDLLTQEECARVGVQPVLGHGFLKWLLLRVPGWLQKVADAAPGHSSEALCRLLFQGMIVKAWDGHVHFLVPDSIASLRRLA